MVKSSRLTPRQRVVLDAIHQSVNLFGRPPTLRELGERLDIASTNGVRDHLKALEEKGHIRRDGRSARGIRLLTGRRGSHEAPFEALADGADGERSALQAADRGRASVVVPVLGKVAAGTPILADQNVESHLSLDASLLRDGNVFALRVAGDSMRDAGILDGDFVFVRQQGNAQPRDIVVALLDDETTVKRFVPETGGQRIRLEPENPAYRPIVVERDAARLKILGKVCAVLRTI
jgi:repressor LexA